MRDTLKWVGSGVRCKNDNSRGPPTNPATPHGGGGWGGCSNAMGHTPRGAGDDLCRTFVVSSPKLEASFTAQDLAPKWVGAAQKRPPDIYFDGP